MAEFEEMNFEQCNGCGLIWDDTMGHGSNDCPRCNAQDLIDNLEGTLEDLRVELDETNAEVDVLRDLLDEVNDYADSIVHVIWKNQHK